MTPAQPRHEGQRIVFRGQPGSGVGDLPSVLTSEGFVRTEWELSFEERGAILDGARVVLEFASAMPPCVIFVEGVSYDVDLRGLSG